MKFYHLTAAFCFLAVMLTQAFSCGDPKISPEQEDSSAQTTTQNDAQSDDIFAGLDEKNFEGTAFRIIGQNRPDRQNFYYEEMDGDLINDAIRRRDIETMERLNITIEYTGDEDRNKIASMVQKVVNAGEEAYDMVINALSSGINTLTTGNALYDLREIPYLTLDSEYWNKSIYENVNFFGKQYFSSGSISPLFYQTPIVMIYNQRIAEEEQIGDLYQLVLDGKWTIDRMAAMVRDISKDLNGDGKMDETDFWGFCADGTFGNALYTAAGLDTVEIKDNSYRLTLDSERSVEVIQKCSTLFGDRSKYLIDPKGDLEYANAFMSGNCLFLGNVIYDTIPRRDMKDNFGIIPVPKYDETQDGYYTTCNTWLPTGIAVPNTCSDPEKNGLIMETMARISHKALLPSVYELTLHGKVARDDKSSQMLDLIYQNASFDFNTIFNFEDTAILLRYAMLGDVPNFVSDYTSRKAAAQKALDEILKFAWEENN